MKTDLVVEGYLIHNGRVLMVNHKELDLWLPPGGHIKKNETPDDALEREFREELGLKIEILNSNEVPKVGDIKKHLALPFYANVHKVGNHEHCCFYYLCIPKNFGKLKINKSELEDFAWFSPGQLNQECIPPDHRHIAAKAFKLFNALKRK